MFRDVHQERVIELEAESAHMAQSLATGQAVREALWDYKNADVFSAPAEEVPE